MGRVLGRDLGAIGEAVRRVSYPATLAGEPHSATRAERQATRIVTSGKHYSLFALRRLQLRFRRGRICPAQSSLVAIGRTASKVGTSLWMVRRDRPCANISKGGESKGIRMTEYSEAGEQAVRSGQAVRQFRRAEHRHDGAVRDDRIGPAQIPTIAKDRRKHRRAEHAHDGAVGRDRMRSAQVSLKTKKCWAYEVGPIRDYSGGGGLMTREAATTTAKDVAL
jgi:hypothetical protein